MDEIFNSLIENVNEDARAGIASYIAQLARDTASSSGGGSAPNKKQHQERLAEYAKQIQSSCTEAPRRVRRRCREPNEEK